MATQSKKQAIWNAKIVKRAIVDSFKKLHPRKMMGNPVMFVVEVGSVLTTLQLIRGIIAPIPGVTSPGFELQITLWLWFTVLFANFAEAMAEGRGKAQADNLRKAKTETIAHRVISGAQTDRGPQAGSPRGVLGNYTKSHEATGLYLLSAPLRTG